MPRGPIATCGRVPGCCERPGVLSASGSESSTVSDPVRQMLYVPITAPKHRHGKARPFSAGQERSHMRRLISRAVIAFWALPALAVAASPPSPASQAAAVKQCTTERNANAAAFKVLYGTLPNRSNAFGKCVSKLAQQNEQEHSNAAAQCRTERSGGATAFAGKYGTGPNHKNAFGNCVSMKAKVAASARVEAAARRHTVRRRHGDGQHERAHRGREGRGGGTNAPRGATTAPERARGKEPPPADEMRAQGEGQGPDEPRERPKTKP